jgi:hypothetical protein
MAEPERLLLPERRNALESCLAQRPRDERQKAGYRLALQAVKVRQVAPLRALPAHLSAHADESESLQAPWK